MAQSIYSSDSTRKAILTSAVVNVSYFQGSTDALPESPAENELLFQYDTAVMLRWDGTQWLDRGAEMPVVGKIGICSIRALYDGKTYDGAVIVQKTSYGWKIRSMDEYQATWIVENDVLPIGERFNGKAFVTVGDYSKERPEVGDDIILTDKSTVWGCGKVTLTSVMGTEITVTASGDPTEIMRFVDAAYISIKDRTINSEEFVPLTTHDGTETRIVLKPAFDWRVGGVLPQELVERIRAAGDNGATLILTQIDLSDPSVPHDMIMITARASDKGYFTYTITVFDMENDPIATFGINSADGSIISEVSVTLSSFDVTAVVPDFTAIHYVYAYSDDEYSETLDDAHIAAAELLLHAVAVHETETINADMLDRYLPTILNKDDVKRHLVKNPGSDPSWDEYRHINGVWKYEGSLTSYNAFQIYRESITLISGEKENPDIGDIVLMYDDFDDLCYGVASIILVWGRSIDIVIIGRNLIPFDYGITFTSDNHLTIDTDRVTTKVVDGKLKALGQLNYNADSSDPISGIGVAEAVHGMIKDVYYSHADGSKTSLLDGNAGADLAPIAGLRKAQGSGNNTSITDATNDHLTAKSYVDEIKAKIPSAATADNQLADKEYVNETVRDMAAEFRGSFATYGDLIAYTGEKSKLDYAIVLSDEMRDGATTRYSYSGSEWLFQYIVNNTPFTQDQIDAINSGVNADDVAAIGAHTQQLHTINSYLAGQDQRLDDDERDIEALQNEVVELQNYPQTVYADSMDANDADNGMTPKNYFCLTWTNYPDGAKSATGFIQYVPAVVKQGLDTLTLGLQSYISFNEASIWQRIKDDSGEWGAWEQVGDSSSKVPIATQNTSNTRISEILNDPNWIKLTNIDGEMKSETAWVGSGVADTITDTNTGAYSILHHMLYDTVLVRSTPRTLSDDSVMTKADVDALLAPLGWS
jgi:hypothetical protein